MSQRAECTMLRTPEPRHSRPAPSPLTERRPLSAGMSRYGVTPNVRHNTSNSYTRPIRMSWCSLYHAERKTHSRCAPFLVRR